MIFILLFLMGLLLFFSYLYERSLLLSPVFIVITVFFGSIFICASNYSIWGDISVECLVVITSGILAFMIGNVLSNKVVFSLKFLLRNDLPKCHISSSKTLFIIVFMLIITAYDYYDVLMVYGGPSDSILEVIAGARQNLYSDNSAMDHNVFVQHGLYICRMIAYIYTYVILFETILKNKKVKVLNIFPILIYLAQVFISTGRTEFIYIIYAAIVMSYCITMSKDSWGIKHNYKYSKQIIGGTTCFIILFLAISNLRSTGEFHAFRTLSIYGGSSIKALSDYLATHGLWSDSHFFGEETMSLYYSILKAFDFTNNSSTPVLELTYIGDQITNIYTALRRYIHDYGFFGMLLIMFVLGYIYSVAFKKIKTNNIQGLGLITYSFLSYPLIEMSIEERFLSNLITARTIFCLFYLYLLFYFLVGFESHKAAKGV